MNFYEIQNKPAPCEQEETDFKCPYGVVDLMPGNYFAWQLYQKCSSQVIVAGMGDILGIKFEAIDFLFNLYKINNRYERKILFEKIQLVDSIRLKCQNAIQKREREKQKAKNKRH